MIKRRSIKLRLRRFARQQQQQVGDIGQVADEQINRHFFRRLSRLFEVRRFVIGWTLLVGLLILAVLLQFNAMQAHYKKSMFVSGGIMSEGIAGNYTNGNPIYATGSVDLAVSKLIFASLFKYNSQGELVADLAEKIESDPTEKIYTITLKDNIFWHDGQPVTADDVAFTFATIQDPDAKSYLFNSWQGIKVEAKSPKIVQFTLNDTLSSFPHSLTTGIIPSHVLKNIPAEQLRSSDFNTIHPVGAGPFKIDVVEAASSSKDKDNRQQQIGMTGYEHYHSGQPRLSRYVIKTYKDQPDLEKAYKDKKVNAITGLFKAPDDIVSDPRTIEYTPAVAAQIMVFFKSSGGILNDKTVRQALVLATSKPEITASIGYPLKLIDGPLLNSQTGYDPAFFQKTQNFKAAREVLDKAGWVLDPVSGTRSRKGVPLKFRLFSQSTAEYTAISQALQSKWKQLGVDVEVILQEEEELKSTLSAHTYDALLYAISTGADPDVFAYWHSSQADIRSETRLNFSEYNSPAADEALTAGRSRSDPAIRAVKYKPFLKAWQTDNPALALYQPRFIFIVRAPFEGLQTKTLITPVDRYSDVQSWVIRQEKRAE
jgi:peptide/nickel transport system substrate-binding protein